MLGVGRPTAQPASSEPLQLEAKIPLGEVRGRIDHMAVDLVRQRVFVAELGNNSVGIVDLQKREVIQTISGLLEPQGLGYLPATDSLYIANAGDGSVRVFAGANYAAAGRIDLGEDADNIRVDTAAGQIVVGYGSGGLAAIDARTLQRIADIPLPVHPEGFQLDPASSQVFVNLPKAHAIAAADRRSGKLTASWPVTIAGDNFPLALRRDAGQILTVFRNPAKLAAFSTKDGTLLASQTSAAMPTIFSSTQNASVSMSAAAKDSSMCSTPKRAHTDMLHVLRRHPARARRSSFQNWTDCCLQ